MSKMSAEMSGMLAMGMAHLWVCFWIGHVAFPEPGSGPMPWWEFPAFLTMMLSGIGSMAIGHLLGGTLHRTLGSVWKRR